MSFNDLIKLRNSEKIIIVEIDFPLSNDVIISYDDGLWHTDTTQAEILIDSLTNPDRNTVAYADISSVKVIYEGQIYNYSKVSNYADCITQNRSFYYNPSNAEIYFHFNNFDPPLSRQISLGIASGFVDKLGTTNKGRYSDVLYPGRVTSVPSIKFKKDPISFGVLEFQNSSYSLNNNDGYFDGDTFNLDKVSRQEARLYCGFDGLTKDQFQLMHRSVIKDFTRSFQSYVVKGIDFRNQFNKSVPVNIYSSSDYPNIDTDLEGEFVPLAYGKIYNAPCGLINTSTNTFKMCDTTYNSVVSGSVTAYKDGVAVSSGITYDYTNGTFTLSTYNDEEITADFQASSIENPLDIIKDLSDNWAGIAYIDTNYNQTEWERETGNNNIYKIGKFIDDESKIIDVIGDICKSCLGYFYTQRTGLFTLRTYNSSRLVTTRIRNHDWLDDPTEKNPQDDFLSSVVVKYKRNVNDDEYFQYVNNDYRQDAIELYSIENTRTIETDLSDETSAISYSEELLEIASTIPPIFERTTTMRYFNLEIGDFIEACHERDITSTNFKVYEILSIDYNFNNYTIKLNMRFERTADLYIQGYSFINSNIGLNYCTNGGSGLNSGIGVTQYVSQ